mgnify:FL=1
MKVLTEVTLDKLINLYEGIVVQDKKMIELFEPVSDSGIYGMKLRVLDQDKMILGALKCSKANGYSGKE